MAWVGRALEDHLVSTTEPGMKSGCPVPHPPGLEHLQGVHFSG